MKHLKMFLMIICGSLMTSSLWADKQLDALITDYNEKVKKLSKSYQSQKNKYKGVLLKKLELMKKSKMQKGDLEGANAVNKKIKQLQGEVDSSPDADTIVDTGIGDAPPPPGTPPVSKKDIRKYKKAKSPEDVHKALKALNPAYQMNGRFETEDGRIIEINLEDCGVSNIAPLAGLKQLQSVNLGGNPIWDLSPLKSLNLTGIGIWGTDVRDLEQLKNMRLEWLSMANTKIKDISPVKKMPLHHLSMQGCIFIRDFTPIKNCKELRELGLPKQALDMDIDFLKKLKRLRNITTNFDDEGKTAAQFWKEKAAR